MSDNENAVVHEDQRDDPKATNEAIKESLEDYLHRTKEAQEVMREGKGRLTLETPITVGDNTIEALVYDFTDMTGIEYTASMDSDPNAVQAFKITYRQGLSLFATAAAKHTEGLDSRDIIEGIGMTDAVEGVQLATLFFNAATRAGRLRISKR